MSKKWRYTLPVLSGLLVSSAALLLYVKMRGKSSLPGISKNRAEVILKTYSPLYRLIVAQSKHETANFTSNLLRKNNNLFGMKAARIRTTSRSGEDPNGFAIYRSTKDSLEDLRHWFEYNNFPTSIGSAAEYSRLLKSKGYFEDTPQNYSNGMNRFL